MINIQLLVAGKITHLGELSILDNETMHCNVGPEDSSCHKLICGLCGPNHRKGKEELVVMDAFHPSCENGVTEL